MIRLVETDTIKNSQNYETSHHTQIIAEQIRSGNKVVIIHDKLNTKYVESIKQSLS